MTEGAAEVIPQEIAGPPVWYFAHHVAAANEEISSVDAQLFMECVVFFFPCPHCRFHGMEYLAAHPITPETNFAEWLVEYHNAVNRKKYKRHAQIWTLTKAKKEYTARRRDPKMLAKALKVLFYNLQAYDRSTAAVVAEVRERRMKQYENLQLFLSVLQRVWPIPEERSLFQALSIDVEHAHAYLYSVLRTLPSIQSEFPRNMDAKKEFIQEAKTMISLRPSSITSSAGSNSSFARARAVSAQQQQQVQSTLVWIILFLSLFLVLYFALMMQGRYIF